MLTGNYSCCCSGLRRATMNAWDYSSLCLQSTASLVSAEAHLVVGGWWHWLLLCWSREGVVCRGAGTELGAWHRSYLREQMSSHCRVFATWYNQRCALLSGHRWEPLHASQASWGSHTSIDEACIDTSTSKAWIREVDLFTELLALDSGGLVVLSFVFSSWWESTHVWYLHHLLQMIPLKSPEPNDLSLESSVSSRDPLWKTEYQKTHSEKAVRSLLLQSWQSFDSDT